MLWFIVGTRPEMIKLAPVIKAAECHFEVKTIFTGQHPIVPSLARTFGIKHSLGIGIGGTLNDIVSGILLGLDVRLAEGQRPDCVIVQGDTTSAMAAALWAFNCKIKVAHVEAGLRTYDNANPYPEEANRRIISAIASYHYAPTKSAFDALLTEGVTTNVILTGNTAIDAMKLATGKATEWEIPTVLVTLHRRESWGVPIIETLKALVTFLDESHMQAVWPVHFGREVMKIAKEFNHPKLIKTEPCDYMEFIPNMRGAKFILTDSGGVSEEATALGKYTLIVREETERPEAVEVGVARLVSPNYEDVLVALKTAELEYDNVQPSNVFGDGKAAGRIVSHLLAENLS